MQNLICGIVTMACLVLSTSDVSAQYGNRPVPRGYDGVNPVYPNPLAGQFYESQFASPSNYGYGRVTYSNGGFTHGNVYPTGGYVPIYNNVTPGLMYNSNYYYVSPTNSYGFYYNRYRR